MVVWVVLTQDREVLAVTEHMEVVVDRDIFLMEFI
jgi:hypothetical protein